MPQGITTITIEIFDERSFTEDEMIAWTQITIPPQVLSGETFEDWYPLTGKLGEGVEGTIHLVMSYSVSKVFSFTNLNLQQMPIYKLCLTSSLSTSILVSVW